MADLGDGGLEVVVLRAGVHVAADHVCERLGGVLQHGHARQLLLDGPVVGDAAAELHARGRVLGRLAQRRPLRARQRRRHAEAPVVEDVHGYFKAVAHATQYVFHGHLHILVIHLGGVRTLDAHLVLGRPRRHAAESPLDYKSCHLPEKMQCIINYVC